ncbi:ParA family protein [Phytohabitans suffuscus]|uniref:Cobyrinic acid a,c-diamide synthase n=1 Tax=Phytohabitans suffuscus TaxID=624315 RepID=A0A6F8YLV1_9ACTN|nr:AAA family ATPase [Phytohabitans suffuscus]BCB87092.1 cobyrinic acid a,c-diamide synthase [Phytohabitans suffuscus]
MKVVSVINYKGGVGKTTLTANIGAGLAAMGKKVLLIDLDPQASLTFSFFTQDEWLDDLSAKRTIKQWYDTAGDGRAAIKLAELITTPPRVNSLVAGTGGWLDLIASHLDLINTEAILTSAVDPKTGQVPASRYMQVHRRLADGLTDKAFAEYDVVLVDCAPNFNLVTKSAIVASEHLLIPTKPDHLSTRGIDFLGWKVHELVQEYNVHLDETRRRSKAVPRLARPNPAVVFTMVQYYNGDPLGTLGTYISRVRALGVPTFNTMIRDRKAVFAAAPEYGVPAILAANHDTSAELRQLVDEFLTWTGRTPES